MSSSLRSGAVRSPPPATHPKRAARLPTRSDSYGFTCRAASRSCAQCARHAGASQGFGGASGLLSLRATGGAVSLRAPAVSLLAAGAAGSLLCVSASPASLALLSLGPASLAPLNLRSKEGGLAILQPLPISNSCVQHKRQGSGASGVKTLASALNASRASAGRRGSRKASALQLVSKFIRMQTDSAPATRRSASRETKQTSS